jgi:hypothetical protein
MSHRSRWEYFRAVYARYRQAERPQKQAMLDEFCASTGYNRKYAIRLLNGPAPERGDTFSGCAEETGSLAETSRYDWSCQFRPLRQQPAEGRLGYQKLVATTRGGPATLSITLAWTTT